MRATGSAIEITNQSSANDAIVQIWAKPSSGYMNSQRFNIQRNSNGSYRLLSYASNYSKAVVVKSALTSDNAPIIQYTDNGSTNGHWYFEPVNSLKTKSIGKDITTLLQSNDHGWTSLTIHYSYDEECNVAAGSEIYMHRSLYVTAKSSRPSYDTPYGFYVSAITHEDASGNQIKTFSMTDYSVYLPTDIWRHYAKENRDVCVYSNTHNNKGRFTISTTGSIIPYVETFKLDLAY